MVQKAGKFGRLQVTRLQIYYGVTQAETTLFSSEELQSSDLPMTRFPLLLHHKGALIFQIKRPLFWKNGQICPSLGVRLLGLTLCLSEGGFSVASSSFLGEEMCFFGGVVVAFREPFSSFGFFSSTGAVPLSPALANVVFFMRSFCRILAVSLSNDSRKCANDSAAEDPAGACGAVPLA